MSRGVGRRPAESSGGGGPQSTARHQLRLWARNAAPCSSAIRLDDGGSRRPGAGKGRPGRRRRRVEKASATMAKAVGVAAAAASGESFPNTLDLFREIPYEVDI